MQFIANIILFIGFIIGSLYIWAGALSWTNGHSGMPILYGLCVMMVASIIKSYIQK